jgi:hypothetical protein
MRKIRSFDYGLKSSNIHQVLADINERIVVETGITQEVDIISVQHDWIGTGDNKTGVVRVFYWSDK